MRKVCWVSSFTHWLPLTVVMPSTSNLSDCRKTRMACWSLVPGPRASWSTMTLIFWAGAEATRAIDSARVRASLSIDAFIFFHGTIPVSVRLHSNESKEESNRQTAQNQSAHYLANSQFASEVEFQGELNHPWVVHRRVYYPEAGRLSYILHEAGRRSPSGR